MKTKTVREVPVFSWAQFSKMTEAQIKEVVALRTAVRQVQVFGPREVPPPRKVEIAPNR